MRKLFTYLIALTLFVCVAVFSASASETAAITQATVDRDTVSATVRCDIGVSAKAYCAFYDADGRMLEVKTQALTESSNNEIVFTMSDAAAKKATIFVLDADTFIPLCEARSCVCDIETPMATYNNVISGKQILSDCDFAELDAAGTKTLRVIENGNETGTATIANTSELQYGAQGRLTEVYEDRIVYTDTFFAHITQVVPASYDAQGNAVSPAYVQAVVFIPTPNSYYTIISSFQTDAFQTDQFVCVTVEKQDYSVKIVSMESAETKHGFFNGYTGDDNAKELTQITIGDENLNVATKSFGFYSRYGSEDTVNRWLGIEVEVYLDKYGNILWLDKYWLPLNYCVLDSLRLTTEAGEVVLKADIVPMDGQVISNATVASVTRDGMTDTAASFANNTNNLYLIEHTQATSAAAFMPYYDKLCIYTVNQNGQYELMLTGSFGQFDQETADYYGPLRNLDYTYETNRIAEFVSGEEWGYQSITYNGTTSKNSIIPMDADTVVLVRGEDTTLPFAGDYQSYIGFANVPSMMARCVCYHINMQTGFADVVYVSGVGAPSTKITVFAAGDAVSLTGASNGKYIYDVPVYLVDEANGALQKKTYIMKSVRSDLRAPAIGFHLAYLNTNNEIIFGLDNANYDISNANFMGDILTVERDAILGADAYRIVNKNSYSYYPESAEICDTFSTTYKYVFNTANNSSSVTPISSISSDVYNGDMAYVYQNNSNPANPIYCVVVIRS